VVRDRGGEEQEEGLGSRAVSGELQLSSPPPEFGCPGAAELHFGDPSNLTPEIEKKRNSSVRSQLTYFKRRLVSQTPLKREQPKTWFEWRQ